MLPFYLACVIKFLKLCFSQRVNISPMLAEAVKMTLHAHVIIYGDYFAMSF